MPKPYDPELVLALVAAARANRATLTALMHLQLATKTNDPETNKAMDAALEAWEKQIGAIEDITRG